jgi:hypothetical protein
MELERKEFAHMGLIKGFGYSVSLILIVFVTYIFSIGNEGGSGSEKIVPYVLSCCFFAFVVAYGLINVIVIPAITKDRSKEEKIQVKTTFTDIYCLILTWLFWLTYGVVFKDIYQSFGTLWIGIQTLIVFVLVIVSYVPLVMNNKVHTWSVTLLYAFIVLFFYSQDGISSKQPTLVLITKSVLFAILYIINDFKLQIPDNVIRKMENKLKIKTVIAPEDEEDPDDLDDLKELRIRMRSIALLRSYWVLSCANRLIIVSFFQVFAIATYNYCTYADKQRVRNTTNQVKKGLDLIQRSPEPEPQESYVQTKAKKKKQRERRTEVVMPPPVDFEQNIV